MVGVHIDEELPLDEGAIAAWPPFIAPHAPRFKTLQRHGFEFRVIGGGGGVGGWGFTSPQSAICVSKARSVFSRTRLEIG